MRQMRQWRAALRAGTLPRRRRWQLLTAVVLFYLVRDLILYLALPALLWWQTR